MGTFNPWNAHLFECASRRFDRCPDIVAFIPITHIVMTYTVMEYILMAYIVMAYKGRIDEILKSCVMVQRDLTRT